MTERCGAAQARVDFTRHAISLVQLSFVSSEILEYSAVRNMISGIDDILARRLLVKRKNTIGVVWNLANITLDLLFFLLHPY